MSDVEQLRKLGRSRCKKVLLRTCPNSLIKKICECIYNLLKGNIPLKARQKSKLSKYKKTLRQLSNKKLALFKKRRLLVQKGSGFLSLLIPAALSVLSGLIHRN